MGKKKNEHNTEENEVTYTKTSRSTVTKHKPKNPKKKKPSVRNDGNKTKKVLNHRTEQKKRNRNEIVTNVSSHVKTSRITDSHDPQTRNRKHENNN